MTSPTPSPSTLQLHTCVGTTAPDHRPCGAPATHVVVSDNISGPPDAFPACSACADAVRNCDGVTVLDPAPLPTSPPHGAPPP